jgi:hypothetical protein
MKFLLLSLIVFSSAVHAACKPGIGNTCKIGFGQSPYGTCEEDWLFDTQNTPKQPKNKDENAAYICAFNIFDKFILDLKRVPSGDELRQVIKIGAFTCDIYTQSKLSDDQLTMVFVRALKTFPLQARIKGEPPARLCPEGTYDFEH